MSDGTTNLPDDPQKSIGSFVSSFGKPVNFPTQNPDETSLDFLVGGETELDGKDVVDFLSDTLNPDRSKQVTEAIATDPDLREKLVSLKSTWDYLSLLPAPTLSLKPQQQAIGIVQKELRRQRLIGIARRLAATAFSTLLIILAWLAGNNVGRSNLADLEQFSRRLPIIQMLVNIEDTDQFEQLLNDERSAIFERYNSTNARDLAYQIQQFADHSRDLIAPKVLADQYQEYLALSDDRRKFLDSMASRIDTLPDDQKKTAMMRIHGYGLWLDSLGEAEKSSIAAAPPKNRWNRSINNAQQRLRLSETSKKQPISIPELNTPDDVLNLATVTAAWLKMTPQERVVTERRFRNQTKDISKNSDRIRQLMFLIDKSPPGTFPVLELMKKNPPPKIAAKFGPRRQPNSAARQAYQDAVKIASENPAGGPELLAFLQTLPPWLVELIEPLPPDEAHRFLTVLKILVEKNAAATP
jgi:hypothetical protein